MGEKSSQEADVARPADGRTPGAPPRPLVGRREELEVLGSAVEACADGASTVLEITGDPGLGKTRLLAELGELARMRGLTVLSGRASQFEQERSLGVFADPLRSCFGSGRRADREDEPFDEESAALRDLVLPGGAGLGRRVRQVERYRLHHAVSRLLAEAGGERGALLCLDDLHWADDGALELLHYLLRQPPPTPLILACGHRPRQASAKLLAFFGHAAAGYRMARIALGPLDRESCETLLGTEYATERRAQLCRVSGGNPLYLEVLSDLAATSRTAVAEHFTDLPDTLRAALAREVALLTEDELVVLRAAAVLGDPFDPLLLGPVAELEAAATLGALDVLAGMDLVRPTVHSGARPRCQFRHPLLREVVSRDTPPGWWLAAHARADTALRVSGAGPVERAPFIARSARPGDREAVRILTEAAHQTTRSAPTTAAVWLRVALRLSAADVSAEGTRRRYETLLALANVNGVTGDLPTCRSALARALALVPADRPGWRIAVVTLRSVTERILGSTRTARLALEAELARWPATDPTANPLRLQLATLGMARGDFDKAAQYLDTLLACAEAPVGRKTRTAVAACRALGAAYSGQTDALRAYATEAAASLDALDDDQLATLLDEVGQLGWAETLAERHADAIRHTARGITIAQRTGQSYVLPYLLLCRSYAQQETGDLKEGTASAANAEEIAHLLNRPDLIGYALTLRAAATALSQGPTAAVEPAERALSMVDRRGRLWELSAAVLASVRLDQGRPDECVDLIRDITGTGRSATTHALRATWYAMAAQAEIARGNAATAADWAAQAAEAAEAVGLPGQSGHAALAMGCVHQNDPDKAAELLTTAAASFATGGLVLAEARARLLLARALSAANRPEDASAAVGQAKSLADTYGATHLSTVAVNAQRQLGARRSRTNNPNTLSAQESRIAHLVAQGLSNRDIAAGLFVSVKTIEAHLTRIFRKLDVQSRSALASALDRSP